MFDRDCSPSITIPLPLSLQSTLHHHYIIPSLSLQTVTDEVCQSETIRQVLKVEHRIEGGCEVLLDKEQALIREGMM